MSGKTIVIVSDAWHPQVNGVVTTLSRTSEILKSQGHRVEVIGPDRFNRVPMPGYSEIKLAVLPYRKLTRLIDSYAPDAIHVATEGPLGWAARRYCLRKKRPFTTSFHTRFAEYLSARVPIPESWAWQFLKAFHKPAKTTLVATQGLEDELRGRGFGDMARWSRGVDLQQFEPVIEREPRAKPVLLYLGRVAPEKNIGDFLALQARFDAEFEVVGDGPSRAQLERQNPEVRWHGYLTGKPLAQAVANADCMVFPSRTDTFGLVMIEAMATGTPVAAYPEQGPLEVVNSGFSGGLDADLGNAVDTALACSRSNARSHAERFSWERCAQQFLSAMAMS